MYKRSLKHRFIQSFLYGLFSVITVGVIAAFDRDLALRLSASLGGFLFFAVSTVSPMVGSDYGFGFSSLKGIIKTVGAHLIAAAIAYSVFFLWGGLIYWSFDHSILDDGFLTVDYSHEGLYYIPILMALVVASNAIAESVCSKKGYATS